MSLLTINEKTFDNWNFAETSPKLRATPSREFLAVNNSGAEILVGGNEYYLEWAISLGTRIDGTGKVITTYTIPEVEIYSTTDAIGFTGAYYRFTLHDSFGNLLAVWDGFDRVALPAFSGNVAEWEDVYTFNHPQAPILIDRETLSRTQIISLLGEVGGAVTSVFGRTGVITAQSGDYTKAQVGLGNVDNTSDLNKPLSIATQLALDNKQGLNSNLTGISNLTMADNDIIQKKSGSIENRTPAQFKVDLALVKADVGLGNVPNVDTSNATNISSGTLADGRLSSNVPLKNAVNTFTNSNIVVGDVVVAGGALATSAVGPFLYISSMPGTPSGVPTGFTGRVPLVFDTSNNLLYVYDGGWLTIGGGGGSGDMILAAAQTVTGAKTFDPTKLIIGEQASPPAVVARSFWVDSDDSKLYFGKRDGSAWLEVFLSGVSGPVSVANGGTGLTSPGTSGNVLTSNGSTWVSSAPALPSNTLRTFNAIDGAPPATNYATLDTRNSAYVLDFDASTEEAIVFTSTLPRWYAGNGITLFIHWAATSATSGDVKWGASFERGNTDMDADSFATEQTSTGTANSTSGIETITQITFTNSQIDGLLVGERFRLKIARKAADAADTMAGDAELVSIEVKES